ncbi:MAG: hypothetical protein HC880_11230 [Bacteroidia bacterium]|nr:hypothetical protein [Bacteroidia bacterium]
MHKKADAKKEKVVPVWQPVSINDRWLTADTSKLDDLLPSWYHKRQELREGNEDYEAFLKRLERQHAIEKLIYSCIRGK